MGIKLPIAEPNFMAAIKLAQKLAATSDLKLRYVFRNIAFMELSANPRNV